MANWQRSLADAFWSVDRALGGQRRPTRTNKWAARHPVVAGLLGAVPFTLFLLVVSDEEDPYNPAIAVLGGLAIGFVFFLTALAERARQRRLRRLGIWNGS
ncbi:hypothetical protein [Streptomyces sp. NPDC102462]|uniref:hypothetical protein n=1 Tax=Streptomyces sp. NPDC102462 TaxID=3366178 RepID=UPI00382BAA07